MAETEAPTPEQIEERRAKRREETTKARREQETKDLLAIEELETGNGEELATMTTQRYVAGLPVRIAIRPPAEAVYRRFQAQIRKAGDNKDMRQHAGETLADSCWAYPTPEDKETRKAMIAAFPAILNVIALEVHSLVEAKRDDAGKG